MWKLDPRFEKYVHYKNWFEIKTSINDTELDSSDLDKYIYEYAIPYNYFNTEKTVNYNIKYENLMTGKIFSNPTLKPYLKKYWKKIPIMEKNDKTLNTDCDINWIYPAYEDYCARMLIQNQSVTVKDVCYIMNITEEEFEKRCMNDWSCLILTNSSMKEAILKYAQEEKYKSLFNLQLMFLCMNPVVYEILTEPFYHPEKKYCFPYMIPLKWTPYELIKMENGLQTIKYICDICRYMDPSIIPSMDKTIFIYVATYYDELNKLLRELNNSGEYPCYLNILSDFFENTAFDDYSIFPESFCANELSGNIHYIYYLLYKGKIDCSLIKKRYNSRYNCYYYTYNVDINGINTPINLTTSILYSNPNAKDIILNIAREIPSEIDNIMDTLNKSNTDKKNTELCLFILKNDSFFVYNYKEMDRKCNIYKEELMMKTWNPRCVWNMLESGLEVDDM